MLKKKKTDDVKHVLYIPKTPEESVISFFGYLTKCPVTFGYIVLAIHIKMQLLYLNKY